MTTHPDQEYGPIAPDDRDAITEVLSYAFGRTPEEARDWLGRHAPDHVRVVRQSGTAVACAILIEMGQHIGGRTVPMVGVAGVATAPDARGSGVATLLMTGIVRELHERNVPISTLYPATQPLYRRAGYEQAGVWPETTVRPADLPRSRPAGVTLRPYQTSDESDVHALCESHALARNGAIQRNDVMWARVHALRNEPAQRFVLHRNGALTGCLFFVRVPVEGRMAKHRLYVTEICADDRPTADKMLTFLSDHASMVPEIVLQVGPDEPLLALLNEPTYSCHVRDTWMVRMTSLIPALQARGYQPGISANATLRIEDDLLPANTTTVEIRVNDGTAHVEEVPDTNAPSIGVRALASLYTGFRTVQQLRTIGAITGGTPDQLRALAQVLPGARAEMREMF